MTDLPPIGAKVRYAPHGDAGAVGTVEARRNEFGIATVFIRWPQGGGMWCNVNEIEEVQP